MNRPTDFEILYERIKIDGFSQDIPLLEKAFAELPNKGGREYIMMAETYVCAKQEDRCRQFITRMEEKNLKIEIEKDNYLLYRFGSLKKKIGNREDAKAVFRRVIRQEASVNIVAACHFHLGELEYGDGNLSRAREFFRLCLALIPDHHKAREYLEKIQKDNPGEELKDVRRVETGNAQTYPDSLDEDKIHEYQQPPAGLVESYILVQPISVTDSVESSYHFLKHYGIRYFGTGIKAAEKVIHVIADKKFKRKMQNDLDFSGIIAIKVRCELKSAKDKKPFSSLRPVSLKDIDVTFDQQMEDERKNEVRRYQELMAGGTDLGPPLYLSGNILCQLGLPAEEKGIYMLDGARRIMAAALNHCPFIDIVLLIHEEEFFHLQREEIQIGLQEKIQGLQWFNNYQSIPLLGIYGHRNHHRFHLIDLKQFRDKVIYDFGCNIGQSCLKAALSGAEKVVGFEGMDDTLAIANLIKNLSGLKNLDYFKADFNDPDFDKKIDHICPGKSDYSFFFSVYRTKELIQRDRLFHYIIAKTQEGIFFEGHAHEKIDTVEYYEWLFDCFNLRYHFLGYSEGHVRPLFYLPLEKK